jgi:hypothetical protein
MSLFKDLGKIHERVSHRIEAVAGGTIKEIKGSPLISVLWTLTNSLWIGLFDRDREYLRYR